MSSSEKIPVSNNKSFSEEIKDKNLSSIPKSAKDSTLKLSFKKVSSIDLIVNSDSRYPFKEASLP